MILRVGSFCAFGCGLRSAGVGVGSYGAGVGAGLGIGTVTEPEAGMT